MKNRLTHLNKEIINFNLNPDSDIIVAIAQIPVELQNNDNLIKHINPRKQWEFIKKTLEEIKNAKFQGRVTDIAIFPEVSIPSLYVNELKELIKGFYPNFILIAGFDYTTLGQFVELLKTSDNSEKINQISIIMDNNSDYENVKKIKPVNFCSIIVKSNLDVKQYFQPKNYPSIYEQSGSRYTEVLNGKYILNFELRDDFKKKGRSKKLRFTPLMNLHLIYEQSDAEDSIIKKLANLAENDDNTTNFIFGLNCNPQTNHISINDTLHEYSLQTNSKGLNYTFLVNVSRESKIPMAITNSSFGSFIGFNNKPWFNTDYKITMMK